MIEEPNYHFTRTGDREISVVFRALVIPIANDLSWQVGGVISDKILLLFDEDFGILKRLLVKHKEMIAAFVKICHGYANDPQHFPSGAITVEQYDALRTFDLLTPAEIDAFTRFIGRQDQNLEPESDETDGRTQIYLIRDNRTGLIKIGQSYDPVRRLRALIQQDTLLPEPNDFILLCSWRAPGRIERQLHEQFKKDRVRGEWFRLSTNQIGYIKRLGGVS